MNVLSLFSGIGGLDLGLERAGMTVVGQVEIDPWCRQILAKHWPEVPRHDDVRTAAEWWGGRAVDLVCGGFPCQPVSVAGRRQAQADSRWLWPAFAGVIRDLGPRYVLVENVPGLLAHGMGDVLGDLASLGYDAEWDCVPAAFVGAPHIRNRVWIVAYPVGDGLRQQPVTEPRSGRAAVAAIDGQAWHMADSSSSGSPDGRTSPGWRSGTARRLESQRLGSDVADAEGQRCELRPAAPERPGRLASGSDALADATRQRRSRSVFARPDVVNHRPQSSHGDAGTRRDGGWWATEPDVGRVAHGIPRRVDRLRGLGNAVVPQVAEHIGRLIMEAAA